MHSSVVLLGWLGAALSMTLPWPQVWRSCARGHTRGLSATSCWMGVALPVGWITYGLLTGETVQVVTNCVTCVAGLTVLVAVLVKQRDLRTGRALLVSAGGAAGVLAASAGSAAFAAATGTTGAHVAALLGTVLAVTATLSAIPQPMSLLRDRTQDLAGLSPLRWRLGAAACASWMTYGLSTAQPAVWLSAAAGLAGALVVCWVLLTAARPAVPALTSARGVSPVLRPARGTARVVRAAARPVVASEEVTAVLRAVPVQGGRPASARVVRPAAAVTRSARPVAGPGRSARTSRPARAALA
ncbi:SemiSWEET transporter [Actinoplanes sp. NPDC049548]|uniref:SemiSWEET transporter n=1 Tax=Actinoplanes sp. NPDC049548 TaxID=3155152 RepID=UPI003445374F